MSSLGSGRNGRKENGPPANALGWPNSVKSQGRRSPFALEADSRFSSHPVKIDKLLFIGSIPIAVSNAFKERSGNWAAVSSAGIHKFPSVEE